LPTALAEVPRIERERRPAPPRKRLCVASPRLLLHGRERAEQHGRRAAAAALGDVQLADHGLAFGFEFDAHAHPPRSVAATGSTLSSIRNDSSSVGNRRSVSETTAARRASGSSPRWRCTESTNAST